MAFPSEEESLVLVPKNNELQKTYFFIKPYNCIYPLLKVKKVQ